MTAEPRLAPLPADRWDQQARDMLRGHVRLADRYLSGAPDAPPLPNVLGVLGHHLSLASAWLAFNAVLLEDPALDPRHRELMVLRVAWRTGSRYEWLQHVRIGRGLGVTDAQVAALSADEVGDGWPPLERLLLAATDELLDRCVIDDATWAGLAARLDVRQLLEVPFVVGAYHCLAMVFNSVALEPDPGMDPGPAHPGTED
ncbi:hypothetical protein GCM10022221_58810 [Actinocorallia aurea]